MADSAPHTPARRDAPAGILVVVNPSEVEHLSYADPRRVLTDAGIENVSLVTAADVAGIRRGLEEPSTKALILASNSLRDKQLVTALGGDLGLRVQDLLDRGGGVLCLHQLRLAESADWLPPCLMGKEIQLVPRPRSELGSQGSASATDEGARHPALNFPDAVDVDLLNHQVGQSGPRGLYWHFISLVEQEKWSVLLRDRRSSDKRPLLVERRFMSAGRLVFCSIQLDRLTGSCFFPNLVRYLRDGPYRIGLVRTIDDTSIAMDEVRRTLARRSAAVFTHRPATPADIATLHWAVTSGMHNSLVLAPGCRVDELSGDVADLIAERVRSGRLRVVEIGDRAKDDDESSFRVVSMERESVQLLRSAASRMRLAVSAGLADGSLFATFEGLHSIGSLEDGWSFRPRDLQRAVADANRRDIDGSYDETFVATAALAWLRRRATGKTDASVRASVAWLESRRHHETTADVLRAGTTLAYARVLPKNWRADMNERLTTMTRDTGALYELDLLACLKAALALDNPAVPIYAVALAERMRDGAWVEPATTSDCVSSLVQALAAQTSGPAAESIRQAAIIGAQYLRETLTGLATTTTIGSATQARAAAALYRFDAIVGISVEALFDATSGAAAKGAIRDAVAQYDEAVTSAREVIASYEQRLTDLTDRYRATMRLGRWHRIVVAVACYVVYVAAATLVGTASADRAGLLAAWERTVSQPEVHIALLLAMTASLAQWVARGWRRG